MIQRIQSLYFLLVVLLSVSLFFLPLSIKVIPVNSSPGISSSISHKMTIYGITKYEDHKAISTATDYSLVAISMALCLICLAVIFMFKKRKLQIKLSRFALLLCTVFIVVNFFYSDGMSKESAVGIPVKYQAASYFPILQIILLIMAIRAIKKDDELVQSAERIR